VVPLIIACSILLVLNTLSTKTLASNNLKTHTLDKSGIWIE